MRGPTDSRRQRLDLNRPVSFSIKLRNELTGTDATLFSGRMKGEKARSGGAKANLFVYHVNHDWNLPIGYVFLTPADVGGWKRPTLDLIRRV